MSEGLRQGSPFLTSPRRASSIARPEWPWSPSLSYSSNYTSQSTNVQTGVHWDSNRSNNLTSSQTASSTPSGRQNLLIRHNVGTTLGHSHLDSTRQWSYLGFEWIVHEVHKLKDFLESPENSTAEQSDFEILKQSPTLGDNKFKLEIATPLGTAAHSSSTLSLYITSLMMDYSQGFEVSASMMAAIKCQNDRVGERGARPDWVWEFWQNEWTFRQESEVWECPLPPLSALLENPRIRETDSFVVCVQIHCPVGPSLPQQPSVYYVPRDLLDGLEASLDNQNTGDVRFICLEKLNLDRSATQAPSASRNITPTSRQSDSSNSSEPLFSAQTTARKRVIYAHSDILTRRSEYFATMLSSSFAENSGLSPSERKLYTIIVEEADFETVYWLLKYCYANWLLFKECDDPRVAVEGVGAGWSAKWLNDHDGEWDWKVFHKSPSGDDIMNDARSINSGGTVPPSGSIRSTSAEAPAFQISTSTAPPIAQATSGSRSVPVKSINSATSTRQNNSTRRSTIAPPSGTGSANIQPSAIPRSKPVPIPIAQTNFPTGNHYPISPCTTRPQAPVPDPHPHPTPAPGPASALSIYQVAHRYSMPNLADLALDHIMSTITPQSSFALLLATSLWDELHTLVEDYVIEKWDEVSITDEFEHCCQEVAAGEWGPEGGKTLTTVFRRLRSPSIVTT